MRLAIVGAGVSGLGAAYVLSRNHDVDVYERASRAGGHVNTIVHDGLALDTGFIVSNEDNYPLLTRLYRELGVRTQHSQMSFSVSCMRCGLEYSGRQPFAQPRNLVNARFAGLLWEIGRWLRTARTAIVTSACEEQPLEHFLDDQGYSMRFRQHFLVPFTAALWSAAPSRALDIPAGYAVRFFDNHGLLGFRRLRWRTVVGGAQTYVGAVLERIGEVHAALGVRSLRRTDAGVELRTEDDRVHSYDGVVVATHADDALAMLEDPSDDEREILEAFPYTTNEAVVHTDSTLLPQARAARAAWNYRLGADDLPTVTYYLNRLQRLDVDVDYLVTLNQTVDEKHVIARATYEHPLFTATAIQAQTRLAQLLGPRRTAYAGAYHGNGFHEDGLASGIRAAAAFGSRW